MGGLSKAQFSLAFTRHDQVAYSSLFWFNAKDEATRDRQLNRTFMTPADACRLLLPLEVGMSLGAQRETPEASGILSKRMIAEADAHNGRWLRKGVRIPCQQSRRAGLVVDFSTGCVCVSHASGVLGACVVTTSALRSYREVNAGERNLSLVQRGL
jgi:hypothetical protein